MRYLVVGCGGLGCYIVENLMRMNAEEITVCDGDVFSESNLNRQLYATPANLGKQKVAVAAERAKELKFAGTLIAIPEMFTLNNADGMLADIDVVIDALDNTKARFMLEDACAKKNLPIVHGAVGEWNYQVAVAMPGAGLLHKLYDGKIVKNTLLTTAATVQACAAAETAEAIKLSKGIKSDLENKVLIADLQYNSYDIITL